MKRFAARLTFNQFFGAIILAVIVIYSGVATTVQIFRGFNETKKAREDYQRVVSNLLIKSLQAPLIQGSYVEAKLRANSSFDIPQVACVEILTKERPIATCEKPIPVSSEMFEVSEKVYFDEAKSQLAGDVRIVFDNSDIFKAVQTKIAAAIALNLILALVVLIVLYYAGRVITGQLRTILNECSDEGQMDQTDKSLVISEFEFLRQQMATHMAAARVNAETRAAGEIARQVKHDIRSPLGALNMLVKSIGTITEERRSELFTAIQRINDIANDLTQKRPETPRRRLKSVEELPSHLKPENVGELVSALVAEKELRFKDRNGIYFDLTLDLDGDSVFANVCSTKFKRSLSNILDNSVEAISGSGCVTVKVSQTNASVLVSVIDTGSGIPPELLSKLGEKGMTFNKSGGTGLGLYYAVKTLNEFKGSLTVNSDGISGTSVLMEIPKCGIPDSILSAKPI